MADNLRLRTVAQVLDMPAAARVQLALKLGDDDLDLFVRASGLAPDEARRRLRVQRRRGRTPSRAAAGDDRWTLFDRVHRRLAQHRVARALIGAGALAVRGISGTCASCCSCLMPNDCSRRSAPTSAISRARCRIVGRLCAGD